MSNEHVWQIDQITARINDVVVSATFTVDTKAMAYHIRIWVRSGNVIRMFTDSHPVEGNDLASLRAGENFDSLKAMLLSLASTYHEGSSVTTAAAR